MAARNGNERITVQVVNQKVEDLKEAFKDFKANEFKHLRKKVDRIYWLVVSTLVSALLALASTFFSALKG